MYRCKAYRLFVLCFKIFSAGCAFTELVNVLLASVLVCGAGVYSLRTVANASVFGVALLPWGGERPQYPFGTIY